MFSAVTTRQKFLLPRSSDGSRRLMSRQTSAVSDHVAEQGRTERSLVVLDVVRS